MSAAHKANYISADGAYGKADKGTNLATTWIRARVKLLIVRIALSGLIPMGLADWLIQRGGLSHD